MSPNGVIKINVVSLLFFVIIFFLSSFKLKGQSILDKLYSLRIVEGSSVELFDEIEEVSGITLSYSNKLCLKNNLTLTERTNTLRGFIAEILSECDYQVVEKKNKLIVTPSSQDSIKTFVISGFVKSKSSEENLIGSSVYDALRWEGTTSNSFGFYSVALPKGDVIINCSYVGFKTVQHRFVLDKDTVLSFHLEKNAMLSEVPVISFLSHDDINSSRTSTISVPVNQIKKVPSFLGEVDVVRTLQLLPGVNGGNEGVSGLYVRGGGSDQNLFLIDDVPVYNISHLFGFFSVFNEDAINNVTVTKGGFPARYGGRLSSVVDIRMKDGNQEELKGVLSVGMMSSKLALEGPLYKDKTTFSASFRRSYYDLLALPLQSGNNSKTGFYFYDANAKIVHRLNDKNRLYLSFYSGKDKFYTKYNWLEVPNPTQSGNDTETITVNDENYYEWGNTITSLRWNRIITDKLFANVSVAYSDYIYAVGYNSHDIIDDDWQYYKKEYYSGIVDFMSKVDFDYYVVPNHHVRFGANYIYHKFNPGMDILQETLGLETLVDTTIGNSIVYGNEVYFYIEDDFKLGERIQANCGLHASFYDTQGRVYSSFEPRFSARYLVSHGIALKGAYSKMTQYMHMFSSSSVSLPTDFWIPVTDKISPQYAEQTSFGVEWQLRKGFNFSLIGYFKKYENLMEQKEGNSGILYSDDWEDNFVFGKGEAKGLEFLIHKKTGKLSGWLGYTLAKSVQQFSEINDGIPFPTNNDRRHDFSIFGNYVINNHVDISATWQWSSGNTVTLPSQKYYSPSLPTLGTSQISDYSEYISGINQYRMPAFHRLDIGVNFKKNNKLGERIWSFGLYNAYGRQNAFSLYFATDTDEETGETSRSLKQISIIPFPLPYVRYTLKF